MNDAERAQVERALAPLRTGLAADGVELVADGVDQSGEELRLRLVASAEACADCFVSPDLMEAMVLESLAAEGSGISRVRIDAPSVSEQA